MKLHWILFYIPLWLALCFVTYALCQEEYIEFGTPPYIRKIVELEQRIIILESIVYDHND